MATPSRVFHAPFLKVMMIIFEFLKVSGSGITEAFTAIVAPYPDYWLVDMLRRCERLTPVLYFQSAPLYTRWRCDQCRYHDFLISIYPQGFYQSEPMALMQQSLTASATDIADRVRLDITALSLQIPRRWTPRGSAPSTCYVPADYDSSFRLGHAGLHLRMSLGTYHQA
ncbi:hypothetical protein MAP00_001593 [Monascus purpureus]|nr:hypothetical protein MAP00_001593 [Monascus purpureus]